MTRKVIDLTGMHFGRLVVLRRDGSDSNGSAKWLCRCECGNIKSVRSNRLRSGYTQSCGCLAREVSAKKHGEPHGCSNDRLYQVWLAMRNRCNNPKVDRYSSYGARGICVCDEWNKSFTAFRNWSLTNGYDYNAPYGACTLDRIDPNGNYEPDNCRWVGMLTQAHNKRPTPKHTKGLSVTYRGTRYVSLSALADAYGIHPNKIYRRAHRMTIDDAMAEIIGGNNHGSTGR